jgi:hypothetical protein
MTMINDERKLEPLELITSSDIYIIILMNIILLLSIVFGRMNGNVKINYVILLE